MGNLTLSRFVGIDVIRSFAILFVITGHYFINTDVSSISLSDGEMFLLAAMRRLFSISVPLFLIITGYLNINKTISREYYRGGAKVLVSYFIISLVTIVYLIYYNHIDLPVAQWFFKITGFSAIAYGWYIEMWIGLFLLIPFFNILWHSIEHKWQKYILIITLFLLTAVPNFVNKPTLQLLPKFWVFLYPLLFFYIGAYIREYKPVVRLRILFPILILLCVINPLINLCLSDAETVNMKPGSPFGVMGVLIALVFFLCFYRINISNIHICNIFARIAIYSLDMYLISYMFDLFFYQIFQSYYIQNYLLGFFVITACVFFSSFAFAWLKNQLTRFIHHFIK